MKLTKFKDIPRFVRSGGYEVHHSIDFAIQKIEEFQSKDELSALDMDPDFQRGHVWSTEQQVAWLEFFMRGGVTGNVIYFNHPGWQGDYKGEFVIVDGKQRLEAIRRFIYNEIAVFGSYRKEFTDSIWSFCPSIKFNINTLKTRKEVLQWYLDLNSGGTPHSSDEILRVKLLLEKEKK